MRLSHKAEKCKDGLIDLFCGVEGQTPPPEYVIS